VSLFTPTSRPVRRTPQPSARCYKTDTALSSGAAESRSVLGRSIAVATLAIIGTLRVLTAKPDSNRQWRPSLAGWNRWLEQLPSNMNDSETRRVCSGQSTGMHSA